MTGSEPRYYWEITRVHETENAGTANELLLQGWELIGLKERSFSVVDKDGRFATTVAPVYVLGFSGKAGEKASVPVTIPERPVQGSAIVEKQLEALPWIMAQSGRVEYAKDAPADLVLAVKSAKRGIKGAQHHFTAATDGSNTLFRFERGGGKS